MVGNSASIRSSRRVTSRESQRSRARTPVTVATRHRTSSGTGRNPFAAVTSRLSTEAGRRARTAPQTTCSARNSSTVGSAPGLLEPAPSRRRAAEHPVDARRRRRTRTGRGSVRRSGTASRSGPLGEQARRPRGVAQVRREPVVEPGATQDRQPAHGQRQAAARPAARPPPQPRRRSPQHPLFLRQPADAEHHPVGDERTARHRRRAPPAPRWCRRPGPPRGAAQAAPARSTVRRPRAGRR